MASEQGSYTLTEILSQPGVWAQAVEVFYQHVDAFKSLWSAGRFDQILLTGCGSTYYAAQVGAALIQQFAPANARAYPASEIALLPDLVLAAGGSPLLIAVSRSGETSETIEAARVFRARTHQPVVAVTCAGNSTLAAQADLSIAIDAAQEQSIAQTRSFASMIVVLEALAAAISGASDLNTLDRLQPTAERLLSQYQQLAQQLGEDRRIERFFFLGSGALYGIANEAMLKMKEMSLSYSEAFHVLEFRHGPMSMVDEHSLVVGLISEEVYAQEAAVLRQMKARGAQILALAEQDYGLGLADWTHFIELATGLPRWARPVAYLPVLQLMAYYRALSRGQNPDQPANLEFVISLDKSML